MEDINRSGRGKALKSKSTKVALCGIIAGVCVLLMFMTRLLPFFTYALPAICGVLLTIIVIEINRKWAFFTYIAVSVLAFLLAADWEAALLFCLFFGYYPIVKGMLEQMKARVLPWILKAVLFNAAIAAAYGAMVYIFMMPIEEIGEWGRYGLYLMLFLAEGMFLLYDVALTRLITAYLVVWRKRFRRNFHG